MIENLKRYYLLHKGYMYWDSSNSKKGSNIFVKFSDVEEALRSASSNTSQLAIALVNDLAAVNPFSCDKDMLITFINRAKAVRRSATDKPA
ncbi:unnamed protein product [marine sediment metagenome]|uniref:Uncharacterized protein n=1 Tax=marine sediment metagenome TaxID=412755 RepID=X0WJC9_9ZZZZ